MSILKEMKTPVFKAEGIPEIDLKTFGVTFELPKGISKTFSLKEIKKMPKTVLNARMTSVSGWSVRANWEGVLWKDMMEKLPAADDFNYILFSSVKEYTTNVYREDILPDRWLFCYAVDGEPLEAEYGGPLRMLIPNLWGYKSCKWLAHVRFMEKNESGFWETRGYTDRGLIEAGETLDINTREKKTIEGGEVVKF